MSIADRVLGAFGYRKDFTGRNDKYLDAALSGLAVYDVMGSYFTDHVRDFTNERLMRYRRNWQFYRGDHYANQYNDGQRKLVINMIKPIVNKSVDWLMNPGWEVLGAKGNERFAPLLEFIWHMNRKDLLSYHAGQMGAVTGDAMLQITIDEYDKDGNPQPPAKQRIVIRNLNPAYCHPVYDPFDPFKINAVLIQYPIRTSDAPQGALGGMNQRPLVLYSQYVTATQIVEYVNTSEIPGSRRPNKLGIVPIVHIQNLPLAVGYFGESDVDNLCALNEEYNMVAGAIGEIIAYHAAPTTLVYGARAQQMEKGANKIWSGLPVNSRVENLKLEGNLDAANRHLEFLKLAMHEMSGTPEASLGKQQPISNTSNAALETQYMPLIEKTKRKRLTYGEGFRRANQMILMILDQHFGVNLSQYAGDLASLYNTGVRWGSPLPADEREKLELLKLKVDNGFESMLGALRELGTKDIQRKAIEITADKRQRLAEQVETAVASVGARPVNLNVTGLGSTVVGTGISDVFDEQDEQMRQIEESRIEAATPPEPEPVAAKKPSTP